MAITVFVPNNYTYIIALSIFNVFEMKTWNSLNCLYSWKTVDLISIAAGWMADANASPYLDGPRHHHLQPLCITIHNVYSFSFWRNTVCLFGAWIDHKGSIIMRVFFVVAFIRIMMMMSASFQIIMCSIIAEWVCSWLKRIDVVSIRLVCGHFIGHFFHVQCSAFSWFHNKRSGFCFSSF